MPAPSQVSASNVNTELGVGSSTQLRWGNNWVRNVTTQYTGTDSTVNGSKMRWGINFPGGTISNTLGYNVNVQYGLDSTLYLDGQDILTVYDSSSTVQGSTGITLFSNGVMQIAAGDAQNPQTTYHRTWLTSGVNSDYTAQLRVDSGAITSGTANTDLSLSTNRQWIVATNALFGSGGDQQDLRTASGNLIIKSGSTLIERPFSMYAFAVLGQL
jgi:hypothetical protein